MGTDAVPEPPGAAAWASPPEPAAAADAVARQHRSAYGVEPAGVWAAPGRITLIGEHVDYNDGETLLVALPSRTLVSASRRADGLLRLQSVQASSTWEGEVAGLAPGAASGWAAYAAGAVWALREAGTDVTGLDLLVDSAVPVGSGLSSSAALVCAVGAAVDGLADGGRLLADAAGRERLAELCVRAETIFVGAPTGGMDQAASVRSAPGTALWLDCRSGEIDHVPLDPAAAELALLVIDTRAPHHNDDGQYASRRRACDDAARALGVAALRDVVDLDDALTRLDDETVRRRVRHVVTEIGRVRETVALLRAGGLAEIGPLLDASHASLRDDFEVSCPELDTVVDAARDAGAMGARMTGGGFGGSAVALVPADRSGEIADMITVAALEAGHRRPRILPGNPSGPAERVR